MTPRLLIVNADDLGLTPGINAGILAAHRHGIVTSASMLAIGPSLAGAVAMVSSGEADTMGVGAHLAAVGEDPPLLSAREIPTLVDRSGHLPRSWRRFLPALVARRIDPADLGAEFRAQLDCLLGLGVPLTHVDTHQHLHLHPTVARVVLDVATAAGVKAVRIPESARRGPRGRVIQAFRRRLWHLADEAQRCHPAHFAGLDEAGALHGDRLAAVITRLGEGGVGAAEIGCHPGVAHDPARARYRWGYHWAEELTGLCRPDQLDRAQRAGFRLGTFAAL